MNGKTFTFLQNCCKFSKSTIMCWLISKFSARNLTNSVTSSTMPSTLKRSILIMLLKKYKIKLAYDLHQSSSSFTWLKLRRTNNSNNSITESSGTTSRNTTKRVHPLSTWIELQDTFQSQSWLENKTHLLTSLMLIDLLVNSVTELLCTKNMTTLITMVSPLAKIWLGPKMWLNSFSLLETLSSEWAKFE